MANESTSESSNVPAGQPQPDAVSETISLESQLERVLKSFAEAAGLDSIVELEILDRLFGSAGESANAFVKTTAKELFDKPATFESLNIQSSIITNGSAFFGAVICEMGDLAESDSTYAEMDILPVQIRLVENHRRPLSNYDEMERFILIVTEKITGGVNNGEPVALAQLGKIRYEESMRKNDEGDYDGAIVLAEASVELCDRAEDLYGVLAARGLATGAFAFRKADELGSCPEARTLLDDGVATLEEDLAMAQSMITSSTGQEKLNFERVECNNAMHLMQIAKRTNNVGLAQTSMAALVKNSVFILGKDQDWTMEFTQILSDLETANP